MEYVPNARTIVEATEGKSAAEKIHLQVRFRVIEAPAGRAG